jgi:hypothetical protein
VVKWLESQEGEAPFIFVAAAVKKIRKEVANEQNSKT